MHEDGSLAFWAGLEKKQSSWHRVHHQANAKIITGEFLDSSLYVLVQHPDGVYLEVLPFDAGRADTDTPFEYRLHRKVSEAQCTVTYDPATDRTTYTLPYEVHDPIRVVTRHVTGSQYSPGVVLQVVSTSGTDVIVQGPWALAPVWIGFPYTMRFTFSEPVLKVGEKPVIGTRVQIQRLRLKCKDTGWFQVEVSRSGVPDLETWTYSAAELGVATVLGAVPFGDFDVSVPIKAQAGEFSVSIVSDSHLPCRFTSAGWDFRAHIRRRQL